VAEAVVELLPEPAVAYAQTACGTDPDDLGGTIWRDYNSDGIQDANELGFDGVTVTAYDNDGNGVTTTVNTDGTYNFSDIFATETHIRLEFSGLPDWMESSVHGTNSDTTVQIHTTATCDADLAVQNPSDYCESNPQMLTSCYIQGGTSTASSFASVVRWDKDGATSGRNEYIEYTDEIGSLYGLTYQQASNLIFAGAFAKRHAAWGDGEDGIPGTSDDTGAIYVLNNIEIPDTASNVVDIITIPNSGNTPRGVDGPALFGNGGDCSTATTGTDWVRDSCFFDSLGKEGLGDLDLSHDGNTLWVVNLNDRHLYMVDVTPGGASYGTVYDKGEIADPGCAVSGDWRPFALEFHDGELYVGGVCSGETGNNPSVDKSTTPWTYSDNIANVSTHVLRFNDPFNSANGSAAATEIFEYWQEGQ